MNSITSMPKRVATRLGTFVLSLAINIIEAHQKLLQQAFQAQVPGMSFVPSSQ